MKISSMLKKVRMFSSKAGALSTGMIDKAIIGIVLLVVLFKLYAVLIPEAQTAGDELNASGVPFGSFFVSGGVVFLIIMVALLVLVVRNFMSGTKK